MKSKSQALTIQQGAFFLQTWELHVGTATGPLMDLTDYTAQAEIRDKANSAGNLLATFTCDIDVVNGQLSILLNETTTDSLSFKAGYYDVFLSDAGGIRSKFIHGTVDIEKRVTIWTP